MKKAYLSSVLPKNGVLIYDQDGKKLNFDIQLNRSNGGMTAAGWSVMSKKGIIYMLSDWDSGYDGKDISIPLLTAFMKEIGYELIDER